MQQYICDVIVVGAGPAGSMAAKTVAEKGVDVILIEEHKESGTPVYCAEGLSIGGIKDGGLEPVYPYVTQEINTARVIAPNGKALDLTSDNWTGYVLDRQVFDKTLAENAVKAGSKLMTQTRAIDVIREEDRIVGLIAIQDDTEILFKSKVVIGADGHWSIIRRRAGLQRYFSDYVTCAQYQLGDLDLEDPTRNEFYIGEKYAPGGYAWVFPKSKTVANVGLGVRKKHIKAPINYLKEFCDNDQRFRNAKILKKNGGICPISGVLDKITMDGLILIGDAAGMLIPMTGAGIHCAIESGKMAGKVVAEAVQENNVSNKKLSQFRKEFDKYWGKRIKESSKVVEMLDKFKDEDLNIMAEVINNDDIVALANGENVRATLTGIVKRSPRKLIQLIKAYLR
jgi:digeranylgeranylglycerophospholipid reductase